jgi:hypothetical protein
LSVRVKHSTDHQFFSSKTNLPPSIRARLVDVADVGEKFSATCIIQDCVPRTRFLGANRDGKLYTVAFEYGGIIHSWALLECLLDDAGEIVSMRRVEPTD